MSGKKLNALGDRLAQSASPDDADLVQLESVLACYDEALGSVRDRLVSLGFVPTTRLKTTTTLIEKLRRQETMKLRTVQDVAGARIVVNGGLIDQDAAERLIISEFTDESGVPRKVDRRETPSSGYRAVHVVVKQDDVWVEIQIRTVAQNRWAQIYESLGDLWGRGIRYNGAPIDPDGPAFPEGGSEITRQSLVDTMLDLSRSIARAEDLAKLIDEYKMSSAQVQTLDRSRYGEEGSPTPERLTRRTMIEVDELKARHAKAEDTNKTLMHLLEQVFEVSEV